jgi:acyl-CoA thioesterase I
MDSVMISVQCASLTYGAIRRLCNLTIAGLLWALALAHPGTAAPVTLVALGDSLTAGYGLAPEDGFVPQLQAWLTAQGQDVVVVNAGVSGDTTAGGLSRLDWTLTPDVTAMIVTLGGNDLLRGIDPANSRANLDGILKGAKAKGVRVLLVAMQAPGNYGPDYKATFDAIYPELAAEYQLPLYPGFFAALTDGGPADPAKLAPFLQADGLHPNPEGVKRIVAGIGPAVLDLLAGAVP